GLLVYWAQSRGSILGLGVALGFCIMFLGRRARWLGAVTVVLFGVGVVGEVIPQSWMHDVTRHLTRDTPAEELLTLGGRTATWDRTWDAFAASPVIGSGPQADRYLIHEHVHNAYLYAALQGGLLGLGLFAAGLVAAWRAFFRALRSGVADRLGQRTALIATGAVLAFFTVRSIPEACGAVYAIDLLLMAPAMAYLGALSRLGGAA
ncbi:MAG: O-antigen ligase family protein, partial [Planctomycetes bacterium]|nr:O-antigen ligase family protein [Planctomycetota bacterium]